jgi:hypothetical protein
MVVLVLVLVLAPGGPLGCDRGREEGGGPEGSERAFKDYMKRTKQSEAMIQLNKISKRANEAFVETAAFPTQAAPLTPQIECCTQNAGGKRKCAPTAEDWDKPAWRALDFSMDRDFLFRYSYTPSADGKSFVATAVGDLDCDTTAVTYELRGEAVSGTPRMTITEPPPNAD